MAHIGSTLDRRLRRRPPGQALAPHRRCRASAVDGSGAELSFERVLGLLKRILGLRKRDIDIGTDIDVDKAVSIDWGFWSRAVLFQRDMGI